MITAMVEAFNRDTGKEGKPHSPTDKFVECLLAEARKFLPVEDEIGARCQIPDLLAEADSLIRRLRRTQNTLKLADNLRHLSPELDNLLGVEPDPLGLADSIKQSTATKSQFKDLFDRLVKACSIIERSGRKPSSGTAHHYYARELAIRLCRVMEAHGLPVTASGTGGIDILEDGDTPTKAATVLYSSPAVKVVQIIFESVAFPASALTIRDLIAEIKREGLHL